MSDEKRMEDACDIVDQAIRLNTHVAYCLAHWPKAQPGDTYQDAGNPCTYPAAHRMLRATQRRVLSLCQAYATEICGI